MFFDRAVIRVRAGRGGKGCVSFHRARFLPRGGPDGGDGGCGGSVYLCSDPQLTTLADCERRSFYAAEDGKPGGGACRTGRAGRDLVVKVPCGTLVWTFPRGETPLADLVEPGLRLLVARGGKGGRGNKALATATHQTPREAEDGEPGEEAVLELELKLIADVGLVGLPNAGKSTLLRRLSRARPRVAPYPFTTLHPHLGLCDLDDERRLTVADLPGLIEGAHRGAGLGHEFLRHIERTRVLAHLVSSEKGNADLLFEDWRTVEEELASHSRLLFEKPRIAVVTKLDLLPEEKARRLIREFEQKLGREVLGISSVTGTGLGKLLEAFWREAAREREEESGGLRPDAGSQNSPGSVLRRENPASSDRSSPSSSAEGTPPA